MSRTITATVDAWHGTFGRPTDLHGDPADAINSICFARFDLGLSLGWTFIGTADVTLHLVDDKQIIENKVESLRAEQTKVRANATARATDIERQIQQLLAIDYTPEEQT